MFGLRGPRITRLNDTILFFFFFCHCRWVNAPPCDTCGNDTRTQGMGDANSSEKLYGASRVELYRYV